MLVSWIDSQFWWKQRISRISVFNPEIIIQIHCFERFRQYFSTRCWNRFGWFKLQKKITEFPVNQREVLSSALLSYSEELHYNIKNINIRDDDLLIQKYFIHWECLEWSIVDHIKLPSSLWLGVVIIDAVISVIVRLMSWMLRCSLRMFHNWLRESVMMSCWSHKQWKSD